MTSKIRSIENQPQRLIAIVGPTASGKSSLAVQLARHLHTEIISVDSRQVYRGLDIGTGKDIHLYGTGDNKVPVHMLDVVEPSDVYSLFQYQKAVYEIILDWRRKKGPWHPLILCGGTGLYLEAILRRFEIANIPENPALRDEWMSLDKETLWSHLLEIDPEWANRTDSSSKKRIVRALEIAHSRKLGDVPFSQIPEFSFDPIVFVLEPDRETQKLRIKERLQERLKQGLVEEVQGCLSEGIDLSRLQMLGLEYREVGEYLAGYRDKAAMENQLKERIEQFAKRQATWFRGMPKRGLLVQSVLWSDNPNDMMESFFPRIEASWSDLVWRFPLEKPTCSEIAVAAILREDQKLLLVQRSVHETWGAGLWGLPGGHILPFESPAAAIQRETEEELGEAFKVSWEAALAPVRDTFYQGRFRVFLFRGQAENLDIKLNEEHDNWAWVGPEEFKNFSVVTGVDEDLAFLQIWPLEFLHAETLSTPFLSK